MKKRVLSAYWVFFAFSLSYAWPPDVAENVTFYGIGRYGLGAPWTADSLYLGGVFLRDTTKPLIVWLIAGESNTPDTIRIMNPGSDTGIILFTNKSAPGTRVDMSYLPYHNLDTVVFSDINTFGQRQYTGPNRRQGDPQNFKNFDRFTADRYIGGLVLPGRPFPPLRRFFLAGWVTDTVTGQRLDRVEFGVEDWTDFRLRT